MKRLERLWRKKERIGLGLMSGTSADGVDVALAALSGRGLSTRVRLLSFTTFPFEPEMRRRILRLPRARAEEICEMNFILGELLAECVRRFFAQERMDPARVDFIGSHGQTIYHISHHPERRNATLQIGEGAVLAARTGILTVCDFRPADIAAGGTGAPLVPFADYLLFRKRGKVRALLNLGGIANVTVVPGEIEKVMAFDTGPANMIMDGLVKRQSRGRQGWDAGGQIAARGKVDEELLERWMSHPYFSLAPPKSTGREEFGDIFLERTGEHIRGVAFEDLMATAAFFTAASVHRGFRDFIFPAFAADEVYVSGGGMHNRTVMAHLEELFRPVPIRPLNDLGIDGDAKEALAFAILADATLQGMPANIPRATGAARPAVLGKIVL